MFPLEGRSLFDACICPDLQAVRCKAGRWFWVGVMGREIVVSRLVWFPVCLGILGKEGEVPWKSGERSGEQPEIKAIDLESGQSWGCVRGALGDDTAVTELAISRQEQPECHFPPVQMRSIISSEESWAVFAEAEGQYSPLLNGIVITDQVPFFSRRMESPDLLGQLQSEHLQDI